MKKVIIIILAVLLAIDVGVLAYGISKGPATKFDGKAIGLLEAPEESIYENAESWNDVSKLLTNENKAELAAKLLVETTYNLIDAEGFYASYNTYIVASNGDSSCSINFRAFQGTNETYQTLTSSSTFGKRQIKYYNEELLQGSGLAGIGLAEYDAETGEFETKLNSPESTPKTFSKKSKTPDVLRSWFDFPVYLGGDGDLVYASIDASTVTVEDKGGYYALNFSLNAAKATSDEKKYSYLNKHSLGEAATITQINTFTVEANIWKCGLFRNMTVSVEFDGKLDGVSGTATVTKEYKFSYVKQDYSTAYWLRTLDKWDQYLENEEDIEKFNEEIAEFLD